MFLVPAETAGARKEATILWKQGSMSVSQKRRPLMIDERVSQENKKECDRIAREIRRRVSREHLEMNWELEVLDSLFDDSRKQPEEFHDLYVKPLVNEGVGVEAAYQLLVEGVFRPN
jgi:hypothetical protein